MADLDKGMIPTAKSIQGYLTLKESQMFYIPSFQRAYSWGRLQCEKLLEDLLDYFENKREGNDAYFLAMLSQLRKKITIPFQTKVLQQKYSLLMVSREQQHFYSF